MAGRPGALGAARHSKEGGRKAQWWKHSWLLHFQSQSLSLGAGNVPRFFSFSYRNPSWHCLLRSLSLPLPLSGTQASETFLGPKVIKGHLGSISLCIKPRCSACGPTLFSLAVAKICSSHFVKNLSPTLGGSYGCGDAYPLCSRSVSQESRIQLRRES